MAKLTEKAILRTFDEMIREMPFDKITVTALVERCEISSNTFYYHYQDIYKLLDQYLDIKLSRNSTECYSYKEWKDILKIFMHNMQNNRNVVNHIWNSMSRDRIERYAFHVLEEDVWQAFKKRADEMHLSLQTHQTITSAFFNCLFGVIIRFVYDDMDGDVDEIFDPIFDFLEYSIINYAQKESCC